MYKFILKAFVALVAIFFNMWIIGFAVSLADRSSDAGFLGAIGICLLMILADTFLYGILIGPKFKRGSNEL